MKKTSGKISTRLAQIIEAISIVLVLASASTNSVAAQQIPQSSVNGLFTPNSSQRFFEEGRKILNEEERILNEQKLRAGEHILKDNLVDRSNSRHKIPNHHRVLDNNT
jgi:hypothetical protein